MQVRFIVYDMKCAVGREGVFYEIFQMAADIGCVRMYSGRAVSAGAFSCSDFERSGGGPYKETLDALYENLAVGEGSNDQLAGSAGIMETVNALGREAALQGTGFAIEDITGDGVPELLVGSMPGSGESVYAVYTIRNGTPAAVLDGWARNGYYALGGGRFYYHGSGGAAYSAFGTCHLSYDGSRIEWEDFTSPISKTAVRERSGISIIQRAYGRRRKRKNYLFHAAVF